MERTKVISVVNNTAKAPKNQGFLEKCFQSGHSFSSAARYDHFDNSPTIRKLFYLLAGRMSTIICLEFPQFYPQKPNYTHITIPNFYKTPKT